MVGELPPAHRYLVHGELAVRDLLALVRDADIVIGGGGWIVPAALALKVKTFVVLGGHGGHNAPEKITDPRLDLSRIGFAVPENFCQCTNMLHDCDKTIADPVGQFLPLVGQFSRRCLTWWPQHGIGYYPVEAGTRALRSRLFRQLRSQCADRSRPCADAGAGSTSSSGIIAGR